MPNLTSFDVTLETLKSILSIIAIILGGAWTYIKFFRGRVFKPKLELSVAGSLTDREDVRIVTAMVSLKNCGLTRVKIRRQGTLFAFEAITLAEEPDDVELKTDWVQLDLESTLTAHSWVEPGESVHESHLIVLPRSDERVYRLCARVVNERWFMARNEWNAKSIVVAHNKKEGG